MKGRLVAAGAVLLALAAFGCGDNAGNPTGYAPDGLGDTGYLIADVQPLDPDTAQVAVYGEIYDGTTANGYRLYVDQGGNGFRPAADYIAAPTHTYSTGVNAYRIRSLLWNITLDNTFLGRGSRNGVESTSAPLTQRATVFLTDSPLSFARRVDVPLASPGDSAMVDSLPSLTWTAVPGAARYRLHIEGRNGTVYLAIVDGTSQTVGQDVAILIENLPMRGGFLYRWGVDAIDPQDRLIGTTRTLRALLVQ